MTNSRAACCQRAAWLASASNCTRRSRLAMPVHLRSPCSRPVARRLEQILLSAQAGDSGSSCLGGATGARRGDLPDAHLLVDETVPSHVVAPPVDGDVG